MQGLQNWDEGNGKEGKKIGVAGRTADREVVGDDKIIINNDTEFGKGEFEERLEDTQFIDKGKPAINRVEKRL